MDDIIKPGIYDMPAEQYHADPCPEPSLSASLANTIVNRTALHASLQHPHLNHNPMREESSAFDFGSAAHAILLEPNKNIFSIVDAADWRSAKAREERDNARNLGKIALLERDYVRAQDMAEVARSFLDKSKIDGRPLNGVLGHGKAEQTFIAHDDCWLRGRIDFISNDRTLIIDYKTVGRTASPDLFLRNSVFSYGYDIQAAMYCYLNKLLGCKGRTDYVWLVQETEYPYVCSLVGASASILENGLKKVEMAKAIWMQSLHKHKFDGYPEQVIWMDAPPWELAKTEMIQLSYKEGI